MVTGANSGIGREVAEYLCGKGGTVYMVCRNKERAERARTEILERQKPPEVIRCAYLRVCCRRAGSRWSLHIINFSDFDASSTM